jgi:chemotaxis protein CheY-P-specific phosphatase CheC/ActR/RegA family two-component response regulator
MGKVKERLDKIMAVCRGRIEEEVSALLGKTMKISEPETAVTSKEGFFAEPAPKSVLSHIQLVGDITGDGCLIVSVRDAIRIGGTLIMLPDSELNKVISDEEYSEELEDSYGEIANIICGAITVIFEEQYPKKLRLVRTEQEVIVPVKVVVESDEPVANGSYYVMRASMKLEGVEMGELQLLLPAASMGFVEPPTEVEEEKTNAGKAGEVGGSSGDLGISSQQEAESGVIRQETAIEPEVVSIAQLERQKKRVAQLLDVCLEKIGEEVGALLGVSFKVDGWDSEIYCKEELLEQTGGKQVMARMDVRGDKEGEAYILASLKDAIFLGGTLIMLPDSELEEVVRNDEFSADTEDAYGEIANIISGVYTAVFEEQYRYNISFVKKELEIITPDKIDPDSDDVIANEFYFLSAGELVVGEKKLGRLQAVFPLSFFGLEDLAQPVVADEPSATDIVADTACQQTADSSSGEQVISGGTVNQSGTAKSLKGSGNSDSADVLIFSDDEKESASVDELLTRQGYRSKIIDYREHVNNHLTPSVGVVFLIMKEVDEQGFGMAIKLSNSGLTVPLVVAGPAWTHSAVLKAVKYGASDILITPATEMDIQEKLNANMSCKVRQRRDL